LWLWHIFFTSPKARVMYVRSSAFTFSSSHMNPWMFWTTQAHMPNGYIYIALNKAQESCAALLIDNQFQRTWTTDLNPFEVTDRYTAGVCKYVWQDENAFLWKDLEMKYRGKSENITGSSQFLANLSETVTVRLASSASGSVGWLAASMMYFALMSLALSLK
jgi:hypothetical protein